MKNVLTIPAVLILGLGTALASAEFLQDADTDADGFISKPEFQQAHLARMEAHFARLDQDGDGLLSADELSKAAKRHRRNHDRRGHFNPADLVSRLDADSSGGVSQAELEAFRHSFDEEAFQAADIDGSTELDADELHRLLRSRKKQ